MNKTRNHDSTFLNNRSISFQAHQSSATEVPENTLVAMRYAWDLGGIPEIDIRQTKDGIIVGFHDKTIRRTISAPQLSDSDLDKSISEFTFSEIQKWDAGKKFSQKFTGEKIPALEQVIKAMLEDPNRQLYLDFKDVNLEELSQLINKYGAADKIIFAHNNHDNCQKIKKLMPQIHTMLWISGGGTPDGVLKTFNKAKSNNFDSLDIIQIHTHKNDTKKQWPFLETPKFLANRLEEISNKGLEMEILLTGEIDYKEVSKLLDIGVKRYAVDEPKKFVNMVNKILG